MPVSCLLFLFLIPAAAVAAPTPIVAFDDPAGDANGPGSYQKPSNGDLEDGDFDLRRFEVRRDGGDVVFAVTLGASFRQPAVTARDTVTPLPLWNNIYLQNIDIYIDTDPAAPGFTACIPGRRVAFTDGRGWKVAVVLTPQPGPAQSVTQAALGEAGKKVLFPRDLQTRGRTVIARVPASALGGPPRPSWAFSVQVSGARWDRSFDVVDRVARGKPAPDAFTMPVLPMADSWSWGGAPEGTAHPRVIDVLLPDGVDQRQVLGAFDAAAGTWARVPFVGDAVIAPPPPPAPALTVADVADRTVTVAGDVTGLAPLMIGRVQDAEGATVAHIVVVRVLEKGFVADATDGAEHVKRGATVVFPRDR